MGDPPRGYLLNAHMTLTLGSRSHQPKQGLYSFEAFPEQLNLLFHFGYLRGELMIILCN